MAVRISPESRPQRPRPPRARGRPPIENPPPRPSPAPEEEPTPVATPSSPDATPQSEGAPPTPTPTSQTSTRDPEPIPAPENPVTRSDRLAAEAREVRRTQHEAIATRRREFFEENKVKRTMEEAAVLRQVQRERTDQLFRDWNALFMPSMQAYAKEQGWTTDALTTDNLIEQKNPPYFLDPHGILRFNIPSVTSEMKKLGLNEKNPAVIATFDAFRKLSMEEKEDPVNFMLTAKQLLGFFNFKRTETGQPELDEFGWPVIDEDSVNENMSVDKLQWGVFLDQFVTGSGRTTGLFSPLDEHPAGGALLMAASMLFPVKTAIFIAAEQITAGDTPSSTASALGAMRGLEHHYVSPVTDKLAEKLQVGPVGIPKQLEPAISEGLLPSNMLMLFRLTSATPGIATAASSRAATVLGPVGSAAIGQGARWGLEGSFLASTDVTLNAWNEGRDPTPQELGSSIVLGGVGGAAFGIGGSLLGQSLPFIAAGVGGQVLKLPGSRYLLKVTATGFRNAAMMQREAALRYNRITPIAVKELRQRVKSLPYKSEEILDMGSDTELFVHVTNTNNVKSIAEGGMRPSKVAGDLADEVDSAWYGFDVKDLDEGMSRYFNQNSVDEQPPTGLVWALRKRMPGADGTIRDVNVINSTDDLYRDMLRENLRLSGGKKIDQPELFRALKEEGIDVIKFDKGEFTQYAVLNDEAATLVGQLMDEVGRVGVEPSRVLGRRIMTSKNIAHDMSVPELIAELETGRGDWVAPSIWQELADNARTALGLKRPARITFKGMGANSGIGRVAESLDDLTPNPVFERMIKDNLVDQVDIDNWMELSALDGLYSGPVPRNVSRMKWLQAALARAPGVRRATQWIEIGVGRYHDADTIAANRKAMVYASLLRKVFPKKNLLHPNTPVKGAKYVGPQRNQIEHEITGTVADILDIPEFYQGLSPEMRRFAEASTRVYNADAKNSIIMGIEQELIHGTYLPHKPRDYNNPATLISKNAFAHAGRPTGRRLYPTLAEFHAVLRKNGLSGAELDPMALFVGRMARSTQARSQALYVKQIAKHYGRVLKPTERPHLDISDPETLLPENLIQGKNKRIAVRQSIANEVAEAGRMKIITPDAAAIERAVDFFRGMLLSADLSFFGIQGFAMASVDPTRYLRNFGEMTAAVTSREGFMMWTAANSRELAMWSRAGLKFYSSVLDLPSRPNAITRLGRQEWRGVLNDVLKSPVEHIPIAGQLNEVFYNRALPVAKLYAARSGYEILRSVRDESLLARTAGRVPGMGPAEKMFRDLPIIDNLLKRIGGVRGKTDKQLMEAAADVVNNLGGGIDWYAVGARPSLLEKFLILTPGWIRANVGRMVNVTKVADARGVLARRALFHQLAIVSTLSTAISLVSSGQLPSYDPRQTDWLDIQTEEGSFAWFPGKTYIRTLARLGFGVPWLDDKPWELNEEQIRARLQTAWRFGEGRQGQLLRLSTDMWSGKDFLGRRIDNRALYAVQSLAPIVAGEFMEAYREGDRGQALANRLWPEMLGLNTIPIRPHQKRDSFVADSASWRSSGEPFMGRDVETGKPIFLTEYSQLSRAQKDEFDKWDASNKGPHINDEITFESERRDSPFTVPDEVKAVEQDEMAALGEQYEQNWSLGGSGRMYRDGIANIRAASQERIDFFWEQQGTEIPEPKTLRQKLYSGYYEEVVDRAVDPINQTMDTIVFESSENAYFNFIKDQYGDEALAELKADLNIHPSDDKVAQEWRKGREQLENGLWRVMDMTFDPKYLEKYGEFEPEFVEYIMQSNSWEEFIRDWSSQLTMSLIGNPMPPELGELTSRVDLNDGQGITDHTWYEIHMEGSKSAPVAAAQAANIAQSAANKIFKPFDDFRSAVSVAYLQENPEEICTLRYWEYWTDFPAALDGYLGLCPNAPGRR